MAIKLLWISTSLKLWLTSWLRSTRTCHNFSVILLPPYVGSFISLCFTLLEAAAYLFQNSCCSSRSTNGNRNLRFSPCIIYFFEKDVVIWQRRLHAAHFVPVSTDRRMDVRQLAFNDGEFDSVLDKGACLLTPVYCFLHFRTCKRRMSQWIVHKYEERITWICY